MHQRSLFVKLNLLTPKIVFCNPNGSGVRRVNKTILNARGPDITRNIARPVSFFINLWERNWIDNFMAEQFI